MSFTIKSFKKKKTKRTYIKELLQINLIRTRTSYTKREVKKTYTKIPVTIEAIKVPNIANVTIAPKFEKKGFCKWITINTKSKGLSLEIRRPVWVQAKRVSESFSTEHIERFFFSKQILKRCSSFVDKRPQWRNSQVRDWTRTEYEESRKTRHRVTTIHE